MLQRISFQYLLITNHVRLETYEPGIGMDWISALAQALALGKLRPGLQPGDRTRPYVLLAMRNALGTV
jgi:hypothetical protein